MTVTIAGVTIAGVTIGPGLPCRFIAELGNAHNGVKANAIALLHAAKAAGADFAKLQCYTPDELVALRGDGPAPDPWGAQGWSMHDLYTHAATPLDWFPALFAEARRIGLPLFSSVFGLDSLALLQSLDCPAYKIARLDNDQAFLHDACLATRKPLLVSASAPGPRGNLTLWCPPGYPQPDLGLTGDRFTQYDGFSYHGTDHIAGTLAAIMGAQVVECHVQLDDIPSALESEVSLTMTAFAQMIAATRRLDRMHA